jgi:hypothetical protein
VSTPGRFSVAGGPENRRFGAGRQQALPSSGSYPYAYMPRPQTPVVSLPTRHDAERDCCLPISALRRLSLPSGGKIILTDHDYTYFGAQSHGLHAHYTRLHTPRYRNARGFITDLLATLWSGRTCLTTGCGAPTGQQQQVSEPPFRIHSLASDFSWREHGVVRVENL